MKNKLRIKEPIWMSKSIGIAAKRAFADLEIEILYKDKLGNRVFPATYKITKEKIITYPYKYIGRNRIYIVPIRDLAIIKDKDMIDINDLNHINPLWE
jgi:hypothetical protein